ncbi:glycoside hydrolase family 3 protein [Moniliophthora roreri MCA 2997]|uniref:beta-glucosidase n=1 Tax=Moniliophthora roreri (strain MCA 2997) TaxID=1381753 RepID=V2WZP0_MONRO|nr:glycoside hydrolase family 3 protein [Moniliophthora roreri MCA 2997]
MIPLWLICFVPNALAQGISEAASSSFPTVFPTPTTIPPDSISTALVTTTRVFVPIEPYSFTPFPIPSQPSVPGAFPETDPSDPPPVGAVIVPNFGTAWDAAHKKAQSKISEFTLREKVSIVTGIGFTKGRCEGNIGAIEPQDGRGWPGLCLHGGPAGARLADYTTAFPAGINAAATWNRDLIRARGVAIGKEHVAKGINVALGPMTNLGRIPEAGRNWEGFGADPFLAGEAAYETILGMQQQGVQACAKHWIFNEQEHKRMSSSSEVDDRTAHEIYAHPFLRSVQAGVASIMCSYNLINGTYACENDKMLNDVLKREFGFQGYVVSDWGATQSTIAAIPGLDMNMPGDFVFSFDRTGSHFGGNLTAYVQNGTLPEARVDDMATRILASWYLLHQDSPDYPQVNFDARNPLDATTNEHLDVQADHGELSRKIGAASIVLLKNENNGLPLTGGERSILLAGSDAAPPLYGATMFADQLGWDGGVLGLGWGSGAQNYTYLISPYEAIQQRARKTHTSMFWSFDDYNYDKAGNMAIGRDAALVFIASTSGERGEFGVEGDRRNLTAMRETENLILAVAAQNNNTMVIVNTVGPLILESWIDHPNVTAVLWAGLLANEVGNAITDVLYGDWNPSGRLPYTIAKRVEDYGAPLILGGDSSNLTNIIVVPYEDGLNIDYRHFDANNIEPRFEFGFGLSYTQWKYSDFSISAVDSTDGGDAAKEKAWALGKTTSSTDVGSSAAFWLHRPVFNVTFAVQNTGGRYGADVPQLYLNMPTSSGEPPSILKGFINVAAEPDESKQVSILLSRYDLSIWDVEGQGWKKPEGEIGITIGRSSRDGKLRGRIPL